MTDARLRSTRRSNGPALRLNGVSKAFGPTQALCDVGFEVARGEVHGLVGGNGSGKSTLIKILAGVLRPDAGTVQIGRTSLTATLGARPDEARAAGLRVVHQKPSVFPELSVAENLALGATYARGALGTINWREQRRAASQVLERFEIEARPTDEVARLRPATRSMLAIARALQDLEDDEPGILVLDEPTASLPPSEVDLVLGAIRRYASVGHAIVFVSHRLDEILSITERLTVIKDGVKVAQRETSSLDHAALAELIAGRALENSTAPREGALTSHPGRGLEVRGLAGGGLRSATFDVAHGEIVGVAGLLGSGRSSLLRVLFGVTPRTSGTIHLDGERLDPRGPLQAMRAGVAYVPEDRSTESVFADLSLADNLAMASQDRYWRRGVLRRRLERRDSAALIDDFGIKCESPTAPMTSLSGGNQQKAILARWMRRSPVLLMLDEPTHGVDVGARSDIYKLIRQAAEHGTCVIVVSSDAEELESLCDRILVLREGTMTDQLTAEAASNTNLEKIV